MSKKRLIDANDLCISIYATKCCLVKGGSEWVNGYRDALQAVLELVNEETTVDAVEVVYCAECTKSGCCIIEERLVTARAKDRYCGLGERREGE